MPDPECPACGFVDGHAGRCPDNPDPPQDFPNALTTDFRNPITAEELRTRIETIQESIGKDNVAAVEALKRLSQRVRVTGIVAGAGGADCGEVLASIEATRQGIAAGQTSGSLVSQLTGLVGSIIGG